MTVGADRELAVRQLAAELDESPTRIRKALASLEALGLIVTSSPSSSDDKTPPATARVHL